MATFLALAWLCGDVGGEGLSVTGIVVDGRPIQIGQAPVHLPSNARRIDFQFSAASDGDGEGRDPRLRYRLDGRDEGWRDQPASGRAMLRFIDQEGLVIGGLDASLEGETPGWKGAAEQSEFVSRSLSATAPEGTAGAVISFLTHNPEQVVGCLAIDDLSLARERPGETTAVLRLSPLEFDHSAIRPQSLPIGWQRVGTRPELSLVRIRSLPVPHPILVIDDDDAKRFGNWTVTSRVLPETRAGDKVTLSWTAAYSFGIAGVGAASYEGLSPGTYRFRIGAFLPNGDATGVETAVQVVVVPPWHQRRDIWAVGATGLVAAGVFAGRSIAARRLKRKLESLERAHALERERARIARDLHDEIGAALTEIAMQADAVRHEVQEVASPETVQLADGICRSAVSLVRSVDAIVWAVNPANDTLNRFASYLVQSTEQFLDAAGLSMRFHVPSPLPATPLEGGVRHRLFLAVREALNNVAKHAHAQAVTLSLRLGDDMLEIDVEDDGIGFDVSRLPVQANHDGLGNMRQRMREISGGCTIDSATGRGTRVSFRLPLPTFSQTGGASHA